MLWRTFTQGGGSLTSPVLRVSLHPGNGLEASIPVPDGASAGITLAAAGDMRRARDGISTGRREFLARRDAAPGDLYGLRQVHSRQVVVVDSQSAAEVTACEADGMVSTRNDVVLAVTVADCLPIFLVDTESPAFGIVHSGWRGTGIVAEALRSMERRFGSQARSVAAVIGPGIGACCYTVPPDRAALFADRYGPAVIEGDHAAPRLDLRAANLVLREEAGVRDVTVIQDCTSCTPTLGSYRRQGPADYTLMLAWIRR